MFLLRIKVNDVPIEIFYGAKLKHALLKADEALYKKVKLGKAVIKDQEGNVTEINGAVGDGFSYYVKEVDSR
ncbi:hypothetical protein N7Z68_14640 [Alkalihalobacillus sp. MEB203]|uniref:Uncharacterized protein n=1 Tax=Alkalihalobacterium chitinilyticum TaxID=2980103 RepID=A0ABT5VJI8_9BACI|nr:hypothetical protein [Alkalihalobacterium chitinilyticum]MDE5414613.1 hypothetical protein [Alkalihalobacterium chitinilyticum]